MNSAAPPPSAEFDSVGIPDGVREIRPGVFEIMGHVGRRKLVSGIGTAGILAATAWSILSGSTIWMRMLQDVGYGVAWGGTHNWDRGYTECVEHGLYRGCHPEMTPWEFVWDIMIQLSWENGYMQMQLMMIAFILTLPAVFLLRRRPMPVRVDGPRRIVYSWHKPLLGRGELCIAGRRSVEVEKRDHLDSHTYNSKINPLVVTLHSASDPTRKRRFKVGPMDTGDKLPASAAWTLAEGAMQSDALARQYTDRMPDHFKIPWWQRLSLRAPHQLPANIDALAQAWYDRARQRGDESIQRMGEG